MSLTVGQQMLRVDDGTRGVVVKSEGDIPRIRYVEMGEPRFAGKGEKWEPVARPPRNLRAEEMYGIARRADIALRAVEMNEPEKWWIIEASPYDQGLIDAIVAYLKERK